MVEIRVFFIETAFPGCYMLLSLHLMRAASEAHGHVSSQALRAFCRAEEGVSGDDIALSWSMCRVGARGKGSSELSTARPASPTSLAV